MHDETELLIKCKHREHVIIDNTIDSLEYVLNASKINSTEKNLIWQEFLAALDRRKLITKDIYDEYIKIRFK